MFTEQKKLNTKFRTIQKVWVFENKKMFKLEIPNVLEDSILGGIQNYSPSQILLVSVPLFH